MAEQSHRSSDEWGTPRWIVDGFADRIDGFDLDPAAGAESEPIGETRYTREDDGLSQDWHGIVWLNPPYSDPGPWLAKAREEIETERAEIVLALIKGDTSTNWYQKHAMRADYTYYFNQRLQFEGARSVAPFPSHLLFFVADSAEGSDELFSLMGFAGGRVGLMR